MRRPRKKEKVELVDGLYMSPNEVAERWRCGRSSVDRIARRERLTKLCLGVGRNGMVRYIRKEVLAYEESRQVKLV